MIIIGIGKHAQVIKDIYNQNSKIISYEDLTKLPMKILKNENFFIGIGDNFFRQKIFTEFPHLNYVNIIHPSSIISHNVHLGKGNLICPGVIIQTDTIIGNHNIINTKSSIDHHNIIGNFNHLCPNTTLCGTVKIDDLITIGPSSTITNYTSICKKCIIGASSLVLKDITKSGRYWGNPVKYIDDNIH